MVELGGERSSPLGDGRVGVASDPREPSDPIPARGEGSLTIQEVAEQTGLSVHTLRYYERAGIVLPIGRNGGGHRRYTPDEVTFLIFLTRLRTTGMPIQGLRCYAELAREGDSTVDARRRMLEAHRDAVLRHMGELRDNLQALDYKIALYGGEVSSRNT